MVQIVRMIFNIVIISDLCLVILKFGRSKFLLGAFCVSVFMLRTKGPGGGRDLLCVTLAVLTPIRITENQMNTFVKQCTVSIERLNFLSGTTEPN